MLNLLKYELMRKKRIYIILVTIILALTILASIGYNYMDNTYWTTIVVVSILVTIVGCGLFPLIINAVNYYGDYKNRNGYMMFMTPNNGYKIFGSKILAVVIDTLLAFLLIGIFATSTYIVLNGMYPDEIQMIISQAKIGTPEVFSGLSLGSVVALATGVAFVQNVASIILALLAITVSKTLLSQKSFSWFIPLVIFIAMTIIEQTVMTFIIGAANFGDIVSNFGTASISLQADFTMNMTLILGLGLVLYVAFASIYTVIASTLINKRIDL